MVVRRSGTPVFSEVQRGLKALVRDGKIVVGGKDFAEDCPASHGYEIQRSKCRGGRLRHEAEPLASPVRIGEWKIKAYSVLVGCRYQCIGY